VLTIKGGKAAQTNVEVGFRTNTSIQIKKGLVPGDTVMTSNILRAKPGMSVQALN
jgi:membrane fusion protein (multidrug efflux system)